MLRALCLVGLLAIAAALPATASAKGFSGGVASAEVSSNSALAVDARRQGREGHADRRARQAAAPRRQDVRRCSASQGHRQHGAAQGRRAQARHDATTSASRARARSSDRGTFRTAPKASSTKKVRFAWTGDADPVVDPGTKPPPLRAVRRLRADGARGQRVQRQPRRHDLLRHRLAARRVDPLALTVAQKRAKYRTMLDGRQPAARLRAAAGMYNQWDDHEFLNDFAIDQTRYPTRSGNAGGQPGDRDRRRAQALPRRRQGVPRVHAGDLLQGDGIYRSFRWGTQPRGLLPRRALVPRRRRRRRRRLRQPAGLRQPRPRADRAAAHPRAVRGRRARSSPPRRRPAAWSGSTTRPATTSARASSTASRRRSSARRRRSRWS